MKSYHESKAIRRTLKTHNHTLYKKHSIRAVIFELQQTAAVWYRVFYRIRRHHLSDDSFRLVRFLRFKICCTHDKRALKHFFFLSCLKSEHFVSSGNSACTAYTVVNVLRIEGKKKRSHKRWKTFPFDCERAIFRLSTDPQYKCEWADHCPRARTDRVEFEISIPPLLRGTYGSIVKPFAVYGWKKKTCRPLLSN